MIIKGKIKEVLYKGNNLTKVLFEGIEEKHTIIGLIKNDVAKDLCTDEIQTFTLKCRVRSKEVAGETILYQDMYLNKVEAK